MIKLDLNKVPQIKPDPLFKGLPERLKDPKIFNKIEKSLIKVVQTKHKHKTVSSYVKCVECQDKHKKRKELLKSLGFSGTQQYMQWRKIMIIIKDKKNFQL